MKGIFLSTGQAGRSLLAGTGSLWRLAMTASARLLIGPFQGERIRFRAIIDQGVLAGTRSLPLTAMVAVLTGMIMALQSAYQLQEMGAQDLVANLVAISVTRELAPLLTAIIVAGRFGSAIAAELGTMKVSQEVDALTVMGIDPIQFLVVPRLVALAICLPCLTIFSDVVGILGGMGVAVYGIGLNAGSYLSNTLQALVLEDVLAGLVKSFAFALIIGLIGCHKGLTTRGGAEEVGRSTTASVVHSIVLIIAADLFVTATFYVRG